MGNSECTTTQLIKDSLINIREDIGYMRTELGTVRKEVSDHRTHVNMWALRMDSNYDKAMRKMNDIENNCAKTHAIGKAEPTFGFRQLHASGRIAILAVCFLSTLFFVLVLKYGPQLYAEIVK